MTSLTDPSQFLLCISDAWVQVRAEDGRLLGAVPAFADNVETLQLADGHVVEIGMLVIRGVRIPYNKGVDPRQIAGFVPMPDLPEGPLTTGVFRHDAPPARRRAERIGDTAQGDQGDGEPV